MACKQVRGWCVAIGRCAWLFAVCAQPIHAELITIDSFDLPNKGDPFVLPLIDAFEWHHTYSADDDSIIGQEREAWVRVDHSLDVKAIVATGVIGVDLNAVDEGFFSFGSQAFGGQAKSGSFVTLTYDGIGKGTFGSTDLTDGGTNTGFLFRFTNSNGVVPEGLDISITADSSLGGTLTYSGHVSNRGGPFNHLIPFAEFTAQGDASFGTVDTLTFEFNGDRTANVDFSLDRVATVPEPSSLSLLGIGLLILLGRPLRRRLWR